MVRKYGYVNVGNYRMRHSVRYFKNYYLAKAFRKTLSIRGVNFATLQKEGKLWRVNWG